MGNTTVDIDNASRPAPRWFRKLKKALTLLADTACVMLLAMGYKDNSGVILWCRVGLSGILQSFEILLANGEYYSETKPQP